LDTGVLSLITHNLPWQFSGLHVISTVLFVLNIVLFLTFSAVLIARWAMYPVETYRKTFADTEEIAFLGAPVIAYFTIVAQVGITCSTAWGHSFTVLAYVLWWIGVAWILTICTMLYICLAKNQLSNDETLPTAVFLPVVGMMTAAVVGGNIVVYSYKMSPQMAEPVIIVSYLCLGYALLLAITMYAQYMHRLILTGWPEPAKIPGMILTVSGVLPWLVDILTGDRLDLWDSPLQLYKSLVQQQAQKASLQGTTVAPSFKQSLPRLSLQQV